MSTTTALVTTLAAGALVAVALLDTPRATAAAETTAAADTTAPVVAVHPAFRFVEGTQLSDAGPAPSVRVRLTWQRSDASGVCAQRVVVSDLDRPDDPVRTVRPGRDASSVALDVVVAHPYRAEVSVRDCAGNETTRTRTLSVRLLQESDTRVYLDDQDAPWTFERRAQASGGRWAFHRGQVVVFAAARSLALVGATGPGRGAAEVSSISRGPVVLDLDGDARARVVVFQDRWDERTAQDRPVLEVLMESAIVVDAVLLG